MSNDSKQAVQDKSFTNYFGSLDVVSFEQKIYDISSMVAFASVGIILARVSRGTSSIESLSFLLVVMIFSSIIAATVAVTYKNITLRFRGIPAGLSRVQYARRLQVTSLGMAFIYTVLFVPKVLADSQNISLADLRSAVFVAIVIVILLYVAFMYGRKKQTKIKS